MKTVIMAGGKGTRIASVASDIPKPMIPIDGIPVLEREIECLEKQGFTDLILTVGHLRQVIMDHFGDGSSFGVKIEYFEEEQPLGNAGALFQLRSVLQEDFLLLNADAIFDVDFERFAAYHREKGGLATLFAHPNSHPYDSGLLVTDAEGHVEQWLSREDPRPEYYRNLVNAGLHVLSPRVLDLALGRAGIQPGAQPGEQTGAQSGEQSGEHPGEGQAAGPVKKWDLDRELLKPLSGTGQMYAYVSPEYVKDMGTPDRYEAVCRDYAAGTVRAKNLKEKQKAVFLDRDGTINKEVGFCHSAEEFELLPWAADNIRRINESGYLAVVVTNQPVIARGGMSFEELERMHRKLETELGKQGAYLDRIYFCPHHPDKGFPGEVPELKIECSCRKPKPGMLLKAAEELNIDLSKSLMVGDSERDRKAGEAAGVRKCITVGTNEPWEIGEELI